MRASSRARTLALLVPLHVPYALTDAVVFVLGDRRQDREHQL
jgi:hypothetical protein